MKDNIVQIRTQKRVVKHGDEKSYFYGRIMLSFNEVLQDFTNSKKNRTFVAVIRNVVFDEIEVDNVIFDEKTNKEVVNGKITQRKIIAFNDKAYTVNYDSADQLYTHLKKVVKSCANHNEIKLFSLMHDTKASKTHYPKAKYVNDGFDYTNAFN